MERRAVWAASDSSARSRSAIAPATRKRPLPAAEIDGAEVSWALPYGNAQAAYPRAAPSVGKMMAGSAGAAATGETSLRSSYTWIRKRCVASNEHDIGDENDGLGVARFAARVGRFRRYLDGIAFFDRAGRLPLDRQLEAAFHDIGGFDSRMRVSGDGHARLYRRFH